MSDTRLNYLFQDIAGTGRIFDIIRPRLQPAFKTAFRLCRKYSRTFIINNFPEICLREVICCCRSIPDYFLYRIPCNDVKDAFCIIGIAQDSNNIRRLHPFLKLKSPRLQRLGCTCS